MQHSDSRPITCPVRSSKESCMLVFCWVCLGKKRNCPKSSIWSGQKLLVLRRIKGKTHKICSESSGRALHQLSQHRQDCMFSGGNLSCSWFVIFFFLTWVSGLFQVLCWVRRFYASVTFKSSSDVSVCATCFCILQWDDVLRLSATCCIRTHKAQKYIITMCSYSISNLFF